MNNNIKLKSFKEIMNSNNNSIATTKDNNIYKLTGNIYNGYEDGIETISLNAKSSKKNLTLEYVKGQNNLNINLGDMVKNNLFDYNKYNTMLEEYLDNCDSKRDKASVSALFLATIMPKMNYFWGGGHGEDKVSLGIDYNWGKPSLVTVSGSDNTGNYIPKSLDCSGFISWCFKQAGIDDTKTDLLSSDFLELGTEYKVTDKEVTNVLKVGDLAYMEGHIGMVIDVDSKDNLVTVAHCSGSGGGMNITTISTETGLITNDETGSDINRVGKEYFTDFIVLDYDNL